MTCSTSSAQAHVIVPPCPPVLLKHKLQDTLAQSRNTQTLGVQGGSSAVDVPTCSGQEVGEGAQGSDVMDQGSLMKTAKQGHTTVQHREIRSLRIRMVSHLTMSIEQQAVAHYVGNSNSKAFQLTLRLAYCIIH